MDYHGATPLFDPSYHLGLFLVSSELLPKAWEASCTAYTSNDPFFTGEEEEDQEEGRVFIAFQGSLDWVDVFKADGTFGQCEIDSQSDDDLFGFMEDGALVHSGIFKSFKHIWENSGIQSQVLKAQEQKKTIVFTGHSLAGAIASLATLCVLGKYGRTVSVFCVTFGCPLIGDDKFGQAIRRNGWDSKFCHVVSVHDIVSRVLLAPLELIHEPMEALLPYWFRSMAEGSNDKTNSVMAGIPLSNQQIADFCSVVLNYVSALVTYSNPASSTAPASKIRQSIKSVFNLSPYGPFGSYLFCSRTGAVCVENREVVLQLLYHSLENLDLSTDLAREACISEHTQYGSCFARILNSKMTLGRTHVHLALPEERSAYDICVALEIEALGLGIQNVRAQLALQNTGEVEKRLTMNSNKQLIELGKAQRAMAELEWYKKRCKDDGIGCYDSFKLQKDKKDFRANINRIRLASFWDEIIRMVENNELPEDFQCRSKWIYAATAYRQLVEPLDIAYHYRLDKQVSGHYLSAGRPRRYEILQKWFEDKMQSKKQLRKPRTQPASVTQDSCFWAYLEEVSEKHPKESMPNLKEFENLVKHLIDAQEVSPEIFLDKSSFMIWWKKELPEDYKLTSPLFSLMEGGWKLYAKLH